MVSKKPQLTTEVGIPVGDSHNNPTTGVRGPAERPAPIHPVHHEAEP